MINPAIYYVYRYVDDVSGIVLYIGKGKNNRCKHHQQVAYGKKRTRFLNKLRQLNDAGTPATIELIIENLTEQQAFAKEIEFIKLYGRKADETGTLYNLTEGGEGCSLAGEVLIKRNKAISKANTGRKLTCVTKSNISKSKIQFYIDNPQAKVEVSKRLANFRAESTFEIKRKEAASRANTGRKISPEHLEIMLNAAAIVHNKPILSSTGLIFKSAKEAAIFFSVSVPIIRNMCCGKREAPINGVFLSYKKDLSWQ